MLRERRDGAAAGLDQIIASCLQGDAFDLDEDAARALLEAAGDSDKLGELILELDASATRGGRESGSGPRRSSGCCKASSKPFRRRAPDQLEPAMQNMAAAIGRLSPEMMVSLLSHRGGAQRRDAGDGGHASSATCRTATIAGFVARNALAEGTSSRPRRPGLPQPRAGRRSSRASADHGPR